jgi:hypothetical protein
MQRPLIRVAWWLPLLLFSAFAACDGDDLSPVGLTPGAGGGGAGGESEQPGDGGVPGGPGAGGQPAGAGGESPAVGPGGAGGEGGQPVEPVAGSGGVDPAGEQLPLCARLSLKTTRATTHSREFAKAIYADCRLSWLVPLTPDLSEYRQQLAVWDLEFWGCQGKPVRTFGLVWGMPQLSAGDVTALIEAYLVATDAPAAELGLSPLEYEQMKSALERLAAPYIVDPSTEPSNPSCDLDSGGAGGAANETRAAGAGGTP